MADEQATLNLKVLSPSTELEGGVTFAALPTSTTVGQLRHRIQDAVSSKPAPDRMRLIYRGRVISDDAQSLETVFGAENIRENKDQSLHLVLPPTIPSTASPALRSSPSPANPFRAAQGPPAASPPQTNPFRPAVTAPQTSGPQPYYHHTHAHHAHGHPHTHHHHHHAPGAANPLAIPVPAQLPAQLQQHIAQALAQAGQPNAQPPTAQGSQPVNPTLPNPLANAQGPIPISGLPNPPGFALPNAAPNGGRTVRQEGIGPNGARWSVTFNEMNVPVQAQQRAASPFLVNPNLPGFALPAQPMAPLNLGEAIARSLPQIRSMLESARQEVANARALYQTPAGATSSPSAVAASPSWRFGRVRSHLQLAYRSLEIAERELTVAVGSAPLFQRAANPDLMDVRRSMYELRTQAEELTRRVDQDEHGNSTNTNDSTGTATPSSRAPVTSSTPSSGSAPVQDATTQRTPSQPLNQSTQSTLPADYPPELFLLSSPQGPVGIIFDQRGTYTTAPIVPTLPFQTFTNQFAQNQQLIAGLGQQIAQRNGLSGALSSATPTPTQQPATGDAQQQQPQNPALNPQGNEIWHAQPAAQAQPAPANPAPAADNDRVANLGGHIWLILKLACFVYFFTGNGSGYYRPILLGIIASIVYLAQTGLFEDQFNLVRRHFEALLPVGALADRVAAPVAANVPQNGAAAGTRNVTPEQAAHRLLQQRREQRFGWAREGFRSVERAFALFVASLWPGIGERMVHAQEERERLERVARREEERREEEEKKRREEEQRGVAEDEGEKTDGADGGPDGEGSAKGKERAGEEQDVGESAAATS